VSKRIYDVVRDGKHRLIRAATPAQAVRFAAASEYQAEVATQEQLVGLLGSGIKVEDAVESSTESVPPIGESAQS
jgi:hypothetical protein